MRKYRQRIHYTETDKALMWDRWQKAAWNRAHRPKTCKLAQNPALARIVANKLQLQWSPRQVAGWSGK